MTNKIENIIDNCLTVALMVTVPLAVAAVFALLVWDAGLIFGFWR